MRIQILREEKTERNKQVRRHVNVYACSAMWLIPPQLKCHRSTELEMVFQVREFRPLPLNVKISLKGVTSWKIVSNLSCSAGKKPMWHWPKPHFNQNNAQVVRKILTLPSSLSRPTKQVPEQCIFLSQWLDPRGWLRRLMSWLVWSYWSRLWQPEATGAVFSGKKQHLAGKGLSAQSISFF